MSSTRDPEIALSTALRERLPLPPQPNYWNEARLIIRDLADVGVRVSATEDQRLREIALDTAVRTIPSGYTKSETVQGAAETYLAFLRGDITQPSRTSTEGDGGAPDEVHTLLDFVWSRTREESSGLVSLQGQSVQEEAASYFVEHGAELLRWEHHVLTVARDVVDAVRRRRS